MTRRFRDSFTLATLLATTLVVALLSSSVASAQRMYEAAESTTTTYNLVNETYWTSYVPIQTLGYSSDSTNFYFWIDGAGATSSTSLCAAGGKFGMPATAENEELIALVKMAFLSGKTVRVQWRERDCSGNAPRPHYLKLAR